MSEESDDGAAEVTDPPELVAFDFGGTLAHRPGMWTKFSLYPDTIAALELARTSGAQTVILSNHVPELDSIVDNLGLANVVDRVLTSARIGVEKPNPKAFRHALGRTRPRHAWMIGDNALADVQGAWTAGMQAAHVRHPNADYPDALTAVQHACNQAQITPGARRATRAR